MPPHTSPKAANPSHTPAHRATKLPSAFMPKQKAVISRNDGRGNVSPYMTTWHGVNNYGAPRLKKKSLAGPLKVVSRFLWTRPGS